MGTDREPTEQDAAALVQRHLDRSPVAVTRFSTGFVNYVYAVRDAANAEVVVRLNRVGRGEHFASAAYWYRWLAPQGVPLPHLLSYDPSPADGSFPFMISTRAAGHDLDLEYPGLRVQEKRELAGQLARVQARVGDLPLGPGFGYAKSYDDSSLHSTWIAFLRTALGRSRERLEGVGLADPRWADRVAEKVEAHQHCFSSVQPCCFLDDIALKNVLVEGGRLTGIVDVDWVCFGDPLVPVALTHARLLQHGWDTDLVTFWGTALELDDERSQALTLYTAMWLVNSLGLLGRTLGNRVEIRVDTSEVAVLTTLLDRFLARL